VFLARDSDGFESKIISLMGQKFWFRSCRLQIGKELEWKLSNCMDFHQKTQGLGQRYFFIRLL